METRFTNLIFEPHGGYGSEIGGETMPFGYISTGTPQPIFQLDTVLVWPVEELGALALKMAAAPDLYDFAAALDASWTEAFPSGPDGDDSGCILSMGAEHKALWRQCRAALSKATPSQDREGEM